MQAILDISKLHMFKFHYLVMKPTFKDQLEVCFMDTDSLFYKIYKADIQDELDKIKICMDFSNYDKTHPLFSENNKYVPGR